MYIFYFTCCWNGLYSRPVFSLCFNFSLFFLYAEWVTPRRFHSRVNQAETPIHQTGMWVLFLLIGGIQRWGDRTSVILAEAGLLSKLSCHPGHPVSPQQRPGAVGEEGRIPSGLTQSPLMEPGVERARTQQRNLEMPLELLGARGLMLWLLVFSSVIWRLMWMDKTVFSKRLLVYLNLSDCLSQRYLVCFLYFQYFLIPDYVVSTLVWPIRHNRH